MAGTVAGGKKAAAKNLARNPNFYREIGAKGGANGNTGGFAGAMCDCTYRPVTHKKAECAGSKGGRKSKRGAARKHVPGFVTDFVTESFDA